LHEITVNPVCLNLETAMDERESEREREREREGERMRIECSILLCAACSISASRISLLRRSFWQ
jgi:hypothetical protein